MDVNVNVKWKFKVDGKEYASVDEMPGPVRDAYEKARAGTFGAGQAAAQAGGPSARIVFNGREYADVESMPADVRETYRSIMQSVRIGSPSGIPKPITPESSLSARKLALWVAVLALLAAYVLMRVAGYAR
jgi:hypothetical protein